jgi:ABC-type glycerol-3-phosphate transport system substrate-binding protein
VKKYSLQVMLLGVVIVLATACGSAGAASSSDVAECMKAGLSKADCEQAMKEVKDLQKK